NAVVLFTIDPTPYELSVRSLEAQLANSSASSRELDEQLAGSVGKVAESKGAILQADSKVREVQSKLDLAHTRVGPNRELVKTGAGDRFALERAETDVRELEAQLDNARSMAVQARAAQTKPTPGEG